MNLKFRLIVFTILSLLTHTANCQQGIKLNTDSFSFIKYNNNYIEYNNRDILCDFYKKWFSDSTSKIVIAHFGDSHIQPDIYTSTVRKRLQQQKGNAGRGMIFPYSIAKTYSQFDYSSSYTGKWTTGNSIQQPPRIPVGISGFAAHTNDTSASFSILFKASLCQGNKTVKIFCNIEKTGYSLTVNSGTYSFKKIFDSTAISNVHYVQFEFPSLCDTLTFQLKKDSIDDKVFKLYGISIEDNTPGVIYHNLGVGGATYSALKHQTYFEEQFQSINPDLAILDWGTNDIIYKNKIDVKLSDIIVETIKRIRKSNPNTLIMLTSAQDMNKKRVNITAARKFSDLVRKIAFENSCLFYDWYKVAGGPKSMKLWYANNLAQKDNIHLNMKGYHLKGELFSQAFFNTLNYYKANDTTNILHIEQPDTTSVDSLQAEQEQEPEEVIVKEIKKPGKDHKKLKEKEKGTGTITYKVKSSDCLGTIARKYNTSIALLKKQNHLKNDKIRSGQKLIISKPKAKKHRR